MDLVVTICALAGGAYALTDVGGKLIGRIRAGRQSAQQALIDAVARSIIEQTGGVPKPDEKTE